ncbi:uncharacterized protein [Blastocystis hominis]|uniref:S1 motif domain-containing protein n=1 Tax=Blastocystis hominis TaxID=12968 RepID=D8M6M8_BLAHO|nr:uncharacterized protein [Blastocystis hominis]CBK23446.2 unnamed protein product [Blastocystis hominis]|eukprot:XP_012897494.1 uncharacterized protein [Blastocystis hominis]
MIRLHYLGLIVEGLFNASVPEDLMPSGSFYDSVKHTWVVKDTAMEIGSVLRVKVDRIHDNNDGMINLICSFV